MLHYIHSLLAYRHHGQLMDIPLSTFFSSIEYEQHKLHFACWNGESQPLDVFVRSRDEWDDWNSWRSNRNDFNRQYIFSLMDFYPEPGIWLFGGIYEVMSRSEVNNAHSYEVQALPQYDHLVGKLKVKAPAIGRARRLKMEDIANDMAILELLRETYSGERFPGYDDISLEFSSLETVFQTNRLDWKTSLENIKGIYLITDKHTGKKYVGSAYGQFGIWSRWQSYMQSGHGYQSDELTKLIEEKGIKYARENFRITLLEHRSMRTDDAVIIQRETFWKEALQTRGAFGYNRN
jgi:hypothetical protein